MIPEEVAFRINAEGDRFAAQMGFTANNTQNILMNRRSKRMKTLSERARDYAEKIPNERLAERLCDDETDKTLIALLAQAFKAGWNARGRQAETDFRDAVYPRSGIQM
jgi:hypothetical protein